MKNVIDYNRLRLQIMITPCLPQATDNSMQLLNLHQTNGNRNQTTGTQFHVRWGLAGDAPTKDALKDTRTELYQLDPSSRNPEFH
jgi:hypothetical protein